MSNELPFKLPITFVKECGMFFDADNNHIADIRGWGHLQYKDNPEDLQDLMGEKIAEAVNGYFSHLTTEDVVDLVKLANEALSYLKGRYGRCENESLIGRLEQAIAKFKESQK